MSESDLPPSTPEADEDHDSLIYELADWEPEMRGRLDMLLRTRGITYQWERVGELYEGDEFTTAGDPQEWEVATNLVVAEADEETIDAILDEVEFPMALEGTDDEGGDDEASYERMANLFNASDKLMHDPTDVTIAGEFIDAADAVKEGAPPFGVDGDLWAEVQRQAGALSAQLDAESEDDTISSLARDLRNLLQPLV
jgi:hypothetical protein